MCPWHSLMAISQRCLVHCEKCNHWTLIGNVHSPVLNVVFCRTSDQTNIFYSNESNFTLMWKYSSISCLNTIKMIHLKMNILGAFYAFTCWDSARWWQELSGRERWGGFTIDLGPRSQTQVPSLPVKVLTAYVTARAQADAVFICSFILPLAVWIQ